MAKWNKHGVYSFEPTYWDENIIIARISGVWNLEAAEEFVNDYYKLVNDVCGGHEWGCINDFRDWELCTPDVIEYFNSKVTDFTNLQNRWQAVLPINPLQKTIVRDYTAAAKDVLITRHFDDESEALAWIRSEMKKSRR
ncbi:hypothetical protein L4C34_05330 [Vibrio profundum]|uniref:hypothetical protein n=1 Tax=Vibrio profundum TaxID=2910247 RepID=UPI003D0AEBB3